MMLAIALVAAAAGLLVVRLTNTRTSPSDQTIAAAINLRIADLPGYVAQPATAQTASDRQLTAQLDRCAPGVNRSPGISSPDFGIPGGAAAVSSNVTRVASPALAQDDLAGIERPGVGSCVARAMLRVNFGAAGPGQPILVTGATASVRPLVLPGSDGGFTLEVRIALAVSGHPLPAVLDVHGLTVGRDELTVTTFTLAQSFAPATATQLVSRVLGRALAQPH
jgi:hypothetical protein